MGSQINVRSIESLKDLRAALALYGDDTLGALGAIEAEVRRTVLWLNQDRPYYWQEQVKRGRERLASAEAELFRKKLGKTAGSSPSTAEQVENVRRAEALLHDAERRLALTRKWQAQLSQAVLEYHGSIRRIKTLASGEVPRAVNLLGRLIDALEAYLGLAPPSASAVAEPPAGIESIATGMLDAEPPAADLPTDDDAPIEP